jgi:hypothetical protein
LIDSDLLVSWKTEKQGRHADERETEIARWFAHADHWCPFFTVLLLFAQQSIT